MKRILTLAVVITLACSSAVWANDAAKPKKLLLDYNIYASGFNAFKAQLEMNLDKDNYAMQLNAQTKGFVGALFPWEGEYKAEGTKKDGKLVPTSSSKASTWKGGTKVTEMEYGKDGEVLGQTVKEHDKVVKQQNIDKILSGNAGDVLTGVLTMLQTVKDSEKCEGEFPVFDGKRRFNLTLHHEGITRIEPSKYSSFSGEAIKCTLKVKPVAGFKEKDKKRGWMAVQSHTEERNKLPTLWLAKTEKSQQVIPVRMEIKSMFGAAIAHLTQETLKN